MFAFLCIYNPLVALVAGAVMASSGESWWAYGLAALGAFNLATQLSSERCPWRRRSDLEPSC